MPAAQPPADFSASSAVAALELLAAAAPARVVAAELVALRADALLGRNRAAAADRAGGRDRGSVAPEQLPATGCRDRLRAGERLVFVREAATVQRLRLLRLLKLTRLLELDLRMEE